MLQPVLRGGYPAAQLAAGERGARTTIAHKGMLLAGKVLAATAIRLFSDSALLAASQQELRQVLAERPYRCPIPAEVSPSVLR